MYIVTIENNGVVTEILNNIEKLKSGKVVKGINTIDSFSFTLLMSNPGFNQVHDFTTLVKVYNRNKKRYDFYGRVLYSDTTMSDTGLITKEVTCENYFGFLCDSQQDVVGTKNWTVNGLLKHIIDKHNEQVEDYKKFTIGTVTVTDPNDNLYLGIQYANTWDTLQEKLVGKLGGELRLRVENGVNYVDYLVEIGKSSATPIALSHNMKSIKQEKDPTAYVTRLIPLGMKMGENDERLTIEEVNNGVKYIDDADGIAKYGIHVGYAEWDDVTEAANLLKKGEAWLKENNRLLIKYSITALDLSLLGLDVDDFDVGNYHPIKNALMGVDDTARIIKKTIDVCEEIKSTIEIGDNFKSMTDIQVSQAQESKNAYSQISKTDIELRLYVAKKLEGVETSIQLGIEGIGLQVVNGEDGKSASIQLTNGTNEDGTPKLIGTAQNIVFDGLVTFSALSGAPGEGTTTRINGGWIEANTLNSAHINLYGDMTVYEDAPGEGQTWEQMDVGGHIGYFAAALRGGGIGAYKKNADGEIAGMLLCNDAYAELSHNLGDSYIQVANQYIKYDAASYMQFLVNDTLLMELEYADEAWSLHTSKSSNGAQADLGTSRYTWGTVYADTDTIETSDRNRKNSIEDLPDKYVALFDLLIPRRFKLNNGKSGRFHVGYIAQEVEEAMSTVGVDSQEFGGFVKSKSADEDGEHLYMLRYGEFGAIYAAKIKQLEARLARLEEA